MLFYPFRTFLCLTMEKTNGKMHLISFSRGEFVICERTCSGIFWPDARADRASEKIPSDRWNASNRQTPQRNRYLETKTAPRKEKMDAEDRSGADNSEWQRTATEKSALIVWMDPMHRSASTHAFRYFVHWLFYPLARLFALHDSNPSTSNTS